LSVNDIKKQNKNIKFKYHGIDFSKKSIDYCIKKFKIDLFSKRDIFETNKNNEFYLKKRNFDLVVSISAIQEKKYFSSKDYLNLFLKKSTKLIKPNGKIIFYFFHIL